MPYTKTTWVNGVAPPISAANLNHLETQYDEAATDLTTHAALFELHNKTVRKTADETVNNSVALQDDDELKFAVAANAIWAIVVMLRISSTAYADFKYAMTIPAAAAIYLQSLATNVFFSVLDEVDGTADQSFFFAGDRTHAPSMIHYLYVGGANAGTVQFRWAQNGAEATNTKVLANSYIIAHRLA